MAYLSDNMLGFAEEPRPLTILNLDGTPMKARQTESYFSEASLMRRYNDMCYFSYSTDNTHLLSYDTGDNPYGPFSYRWVIMTPVVGWITRNAITELKGKWYLFHNNSVSLGGRTWLHSLKVVELECGLIKWIHRKHIVN